MTFTTFAGLENPFSHLRKAIRLFWHYVPLIKPGSFHLVLCLTRKNNLIILSPLVILLCAKYRRKLREITSTSIWGISMEIEKTSIHMYMCI